MISTTPQRRLFTKWSLILAAAVFTAAAGGAEPPAPATVDALSGFGGAKFGGTIEETRKVWPKMNAVADDVRLPSAAFASTHLDRFLVKEHSIVGLSSPVDVELRFWKGNLWAFLVYFQEADAPAALRHLAKEYGKHTTGIDTRPIWRGEKVTLQAMSDAGWYGATDNVISEDARTWFFAALTGKTEAEIEASTAATEKPAAPAAGPDAPAAAAKPDAAPPAP